MLFIPVNFPVLISLIPNHHHYLPLKPALISILPPLISYLVILASLLTIIPTYFLIPVIHYLRFTSLCSILVILGPFIELALLIK